VSKIDDLIAEHCPDGVPFERLRDVGTWYGGGTPSKAVREFWENGSVPWLSPKDMDVETVAATGLSIAEVALERSPLKLVPAGSVAFVMRSNVLRRRLPIAFVPFDVTLNQDMRAVVPRPGILAEYLLQACRARADVILSTTGRTDGSMAAISSPAFLDFRIPVPPAPVQSEIVRFVRNLGALHAELGSQLAAELDLRSRQSAFYRDLLLTFREERGVRWFPMGDVAINHDSRRRPVTKAARESGEIPYYGASGIVDYVSDFIFDGDYLLVSEDGANLLARSTPIAFTSSGKSWINNHAHVLELGTYAERRFLEFYLNSIDLAPYISGAAQPKLSKANLNRIQVPQPSVAEQERIVGILDNFDTLVNDLSVGLAAEINARRAQYEYYRDRLLTFDEAVA